MPGLQEHAEVSRRTVEGSRRAEEWAEDALGTIGSQIAQPDFEFRDHHPRLLMAEVRYATPDRSIPPLGVEYLRVRLYSQGWHWVELLPGGDACLGLAREPILVSLVDGTEFEARTHPEVEDSAWAQRIAREGAWRFDLARPVFVAPAQIVAVSTGPRIRTANGD